MGYETSMIDAKITRFDTESKRSDYDFGDVVLERCVSYYRGLHFTACLEFLDTPVINSFDVANICGNKMITSMLLKKNNIPTPKTYFSFSADAARENLDRVGYPLVIKPVIGSWGRNVIPLKDKDTADAIIEQREITDGPLDRIFYLQEMIDRPPRDIRVITIGDKAVTAMYRKSSDSFKTNIALGAEPEICDITNFRFCTKCNVCFEITRRFSIHCCNCLVSNCNHSNISWRTVYHLLKIENSI